MLNLLADVELPRTLQFLNLGWWIVHLVAIPLVLVIGMVVGKRCCKSADM